MEKYFNAISIILSIIGGWITWLLGGWDVLLWTLTAFVVLDYLTGLAKAWKLKELSSEVGFEGLVKKVMIFTLVIMANFLQQLINESVPLREIVILFFISNEGISLLENAAMFVKIPDELRNVLIQIRDTEDK